MRSVVIAVALLATACGASQTASEDSAATACEGGDRAQCINAARTYIYDAIVTRNSSAELFMREYMGRACKLKHAGACTFLARIYSFGIPAKGPPTAEERAIARAAESRMSALVSPMCQAGDRAACAHLAAYFELTDRPTLAAYYHAGAKGARPALVAMTATPEPSGEVVVAKRIHGTTRIVPTNHIKRRLQRAGITRVVALMRLCLDVTGRPRSVRVILPTGIAEYERLLIRRMRSWEYTPLIIDGQPTPTCQVVVYIYKQTR